MPMLRLRPALSMLALGLAALVLYACGPKPPPSAEAPAGPELPRYRQASFQDLPGWQADSVSAALPALQKSCARMARQPADKSVRAVSAAAGASAFGTLAAWQQACAGLASLPAGNDGAARAAIERLFQPWSVSGDSGSDGLFTGYYEPELNGSLTRSAKFNVPLYRRPGDIVEADLGQFSTDLAGRKLTGKVENGRFIPYDDRAAIVAKGLSGRADVLVWAADPVAAFFLQIQGSGRVELYGADGRPTGETLRVGYEGQNGRTYVAIGKVLLERGELARDGVSMQSIRDWLKAHPGDAASVMNANPSYVFFKKLTTAQPLGGEGVELTPGRSLAVDRRVMPYGVPLWLDAADPLKPENRLQRLMVAQDTGGAIRGAVRGDVFWGAGEDAEAQAGVMKSPGRFWVLLPRGVAPAPVS
ncbi:murein transglycosylase A [Radicibacter daui]|uniref:murein transglycosylase A n=1 Tax=Radicibacter daui TaxID=3064829 RepID=UPI004046F156